MAFRGNFGGGCVAVRLADGASVTVRAVHDEPQDDDALRDLFFSLSDTTRYRYFLAGVPPNEVWAERFVALSSLDGRRSAAVVAEVDGRLVGFACFRQHPQAAPDDGLAEVGIVLTDAWQGRGLGSHLLTWLAREALRRGVSTLVAETLADNQRMLRLTRRIFPNVRIDYSSGSCTLTICLDAWLDAWQSDARGGRERVAC